MTRESVSINNSHAFTKEKATSFNSSNEIIPQNSIKSQGKTTENIQEIIKNFESKVKKDNKLTKIKEYIFNQYKNNLQILFNQKLPPKMHETKLKKLNELSENLVRRDSSFSSMFDFQSNSNSRALGDNLRAAQQELADFMETLEKSHNTITASANDIFSDDFIRISHTQTNAGEPRIALFFNTKPDAKTLFTLKKKGGVYNSTRKEWLFKPTNFEKNKEWFETQLYEAITGEKQTLDLNKANANANIKTKAQIAKEKAKIKQANIAKKWIGKENLLLSDKELSKQMHHFYREKTLKDIAQEHREALNKIIKPLQEFGQNYAEFYQDGQGAVKKLLIESEQAAKDGVEFKGQVAGAFYRDELGDIDLVWGNDNFGLKHILEKHGDEFAKFDGTTQGEKIVNGISEIIIKGEVLDDNGIKTILLKNGIERYRIGLSKGLKGDGVNLWIITSYKVG